MRAITEWFNQEPEPIGCRRDVVIEEREDFSFAFCEGAIACAAEASDRFDDVARTIIGGDLARIAVAIGVVDDKDFSGAGIEPRHCCEALLQESGTVSGADRDGGVGDSLLELTCNRGLGR